MNGKAVAASLLFVTGILCLCVGGVVQGQQATVTTLPVFAVASIHPDHSGATQFRLAFTPDGVRLETGRRS